MQMDVGVHSTQKARTYFMCVSNEYMQDRNRYQQVVSPAAASRTRPASRSRKHLQNSVEAAFYGHLIQEL